MGQNQQSKRGLNHAPSVCSRMISAQRPCVLRNGEPIASVATIKRSSKSFGLSKRNSKSARLSLPVLQVSPIASWLSAIAGGADPNGNAGTAGRSWISSARDAARTGRSIARGIVSCARSRRRQPIRIRSQCDPRSVITSDEAQSCSQDEVR